MGYSPWGLKEADTTEQLSIHTSFLLTLYIVTKLKCTHLCAQCFGLHRQNASGDGKNLRVRRNPKTFNTMPSFHR